MSIVFGTKLEAACAPLAELAAALARRLDVPLRLVHVSEDPRAPFVLGTDEEGILGPVRARLTAEAERLRSLTGARVHVHLAGGAVVNALVSVSELELATALLVGGGAGSTRHVLGSTAERVSRACSVPVLTLRDTARLSGWLRGERPLRVLVGADSGRTATAARAFGAGLRRIGPCELEVVTVASPAETHERLGLPPPADEHALAAEAEEALRRELSRVAPPEEAPATVRVVAGRGSADAHLVGLADQGSFDLVIVGQRRNSLLEQLWYGSVARGVLRSAPVSVACIPRPPSPPAAPFRSPQTAVVGVDFTDVADRAIAQAMGLVVEGGRVHLVHVLPPAGPDRLSAEQAFYELSRRGGGPGESGRAVAVEREVLEGAPVDQLLAAAERAGADLLVLGARSRPALSRMLLGSVARGVSERATVPVLLVPFGHA